MCRDLALREPRPSLDDLKHCPLALRGREAGAGEVAREGVVLRTGEQDTVGLGDGAARATHLLVVVDHRPRPLIVNDEGKVWLVEAHAESHRGA